jgi:Tfp pilus assembly protein PilX
MNKNDKGFALLAVLLLVTVLLGLFSTYMIVTKTELGLVKTSRDSASGFNAAESGLNLRAEEIRNIFLDYDKPSGESPESIEACDAGNIGDADYKCKSYAFDNKHTAMTYVTEAPNNPILTVIPPGEPFAGLNTQEFRYTVRSVGRNNQLSNEAILDLTFKSRLVPLFQFAIFFQDDLEIFNGATMTVTGPVHTNGNFYLSPQSGGTTNLNGQTTMAGTLNRGLKSVSSCTGYAGTANAMNPSSYTTLPACASNRTLVTDVAAWNGNIELDVEPVIVPSPEDFAPFANGEYWRRADLRLVLRLTSAGLPNTTISSTGIEVVNADGTSDATSTANLHSAVNCPGLISTGGGSALSIGTQGPGTTGSQLRLYREYQHDSTLNSYQRTLEVDMLNLLNCIQRYPAIMGGKALNDETEDGLVLYFTIDGPLRTASQNNYSIRLRNGAILQSNIAGAPSVNGVTAISDQGVVIWGNYNSGTTTWVPSAIMGDTMWLLSAGWLDSDSAITTTYDRDGSATTVRAAIISGIRRTGDANGTAGQDKGADSSGGGAINVFRFNEWFRVGTTIPNFTYEGSIVSLGAPLRSQSTWGPFTYYSAPNRVWSYDTRFNDADQLPPMTPVFVYLQQELFVRDYEL